MKFQLLSAIAIALVCSSTLFAQSGSRGAVGGAVGSATRLASPAPVQTLPALGSGTRIDAGPTVFAPAQSPISTVTGPATSSVISGGSPIISGGSPIVSSGPVFSSGAPIASGGCCGTPVAAPVSSCGCSAPAPAPAPVFAAAPSGCGCSSAPRAPIFRSPMRSCCRPAPNPCAAPRRSFGRRGCCN